MIVIKKYRPSNLNEWNEFIACSKNGCFLFIREYMEYHSDRYDDHSLLIYKNDVLVAVIPFNEIGRKLISHDGLTFGGVISDRKMKVQLMLDIFGCLVEYMKGKQISSMIYKAPPIFLHQVPSAEDLYALFRFDAKLIRRDVSTVLDMSNPIKLNKGRKWSINKAKKNKILISASQEYGAFMEVLEVSLAKHGTKPTHSIDEIIYLKEKFPKQISLYTAGYGAEILAGAIIYDYGQTIHTQYLATSEEGKTLGALDLLIHELVSNVYSKKRFFSFGISTTDCGNVLNEGLIHQKEGFGGRAVVHDFYEMDVL